MLVGLDHEGETILTAELDLDEIARGKYDFDVSGHYARPNLFRLELDEMPRRFASTISVPSKL